MRNYERLPVDTQEDDLENGQLNPGLPYAGSKPSALSLVPDSVYDAQDEGLWTPTRTGHALLQRCRSVAGSVRYFLDSNTGLLLVAASQAFFAAMNTAVKKLNNLDPPVSALELVIVRMGITYICCMTYMYWKRVPDPFLGPKEVRWLLAFRGFSGFFGLFGIYFSLQYLSLSDATVLTFLSPMTTAIAGCLVLGESFSRREALAGCMSLVGVVLIARPEFLFGQSSSSAPPVPAADGYLEPSEKGTPAERLIAVGIALLGVLGATGAYTSLRAIGKRAHTLHSLTYFSSMCVITASIGMAITHDPVVIPTRLQWLALLLMIGVFGFLAQVLLTMGLQRETAGRGALAIYVQIVFASIFERIFFHTAPSGLSIAGTVIIMGSAIYVVATKQTSETSNPRRNVHTDDTTQSEIELERQPLRASEDGET